MAPLPRDPARPSRRIVVLGALAGLLAAGCGLFPKTRTPSLTAQVPAPSFDLPDQTGAHHTLAALTARGPAMIVFYRGFW
ncbi:MAG: hypothetical protein QM820_38815 [Minicystis sp.]